MRWRFTGANTKRFDGGPPLSPANCVRTDPRSHYGRKSGLFPQGVWLLPPGGAGSAGPPRVRHGGLPLPRTVLWRLSFTHNSLLTEVLTAINLTAIFHNTVHLFELSTEPNENTITF